MTPEAKKVEKFTVGALWDDNGWEIRYHARVSASDNEKPCKHASPIAVETRPRSDGGTYESRYYTVPRAVVAYNEDGYASTGICLDCILDAIK